LPATRFNVSQPRGAEKVAISGGETKKEVERRKRDEMHAKERRLWIGLLPTGTSDERRGAN